MTNHVSSALFVHTQDTEHLGQGLQNNAYGTGITPVAFDALLQTPEETLSHVDHVVVSGPLSVIKDVLNLATQYGFSVGLLPTSTQKNLIRYYNLPHDAQGAVDLALQADAPAIDLIKCNGKILLFKATVGQIPLLDSPGEVSRLNILTTALNRVFNLRLLEFDFKTAEGRKIGTAASGCMIIQHHKGSLASRLISHDGSVTDAMISMVISAPISVIAYLKFLIQLLGPSAKRQRFPSTTGYIKSARIDIESKTALDVFVDGECVTQTPLHCIALPAAVQMNVGEGLREKSKAGAPAGENLRIENLPRGKELIKAKRKSKIPFFSYASEERFRDLFTSLREDARIDGIYLALMVLSTLLATVGLYLDSASVVIGAMLLAPLMAPIVSLAMGLLRGDSRMAASSLGKIFIGIAIALLASSLITLLFPHKPLTDEMQARLNPTLLDFAVAIISGIAAAYSKSFKEIIQSLAGVAIAVALVPPLSVAGVGIGRLDFHFFYQAFLLFTTNLIGIVMAAAFTFRILGYSAAVRNKRSIAIVLCLSALIAVPLYLSYNRIVEKNVYEQSWQNERFLVNGKYIIVEKADLSSRRGKPVLFMNILARELLTREDMAEFKRKIQTNFDKNLVLRVQTTYIP